MANIRDSLSHTKWLCKYHIVFTPKYRRKAIYGQNKESIGKILRQLCNYKGVEIIEGHLMSDHIHMLVSIHTTQVQRVAIHGIPERQEQPDDIRQARKPEI